MSSFLTLELESATTTKNILKIHLIFAYVSFLLIWTRKEYVHTLPCRSPRGAMRQ